MLHPVFVSARHRSLAPQPTSLFKGNVFVDSAGHTGTTLRYGQPYALSWTGPSQVTGVVLVGLSTMTHSFDTNQRHIQLPVTRSLKMGSLNFVFFTGAPNAQVVPPGHYMLFALDGQRVPSPGVVIQVVP